MKRFLLELESMQEITAQIRDSTEQEAIASKEPPSKILLANGMNPDIITRAMTKAYKVECITDINDIIFDETNAKLLGLQYCYDNYLCPVQYYGENMILMFSLDNTDCVTFIQSKINNIKFCTSNYGIINNTLTHFIVPALTQEKSQDIGNDYQSANGLDAEKSNDTISTFMLVLEAALDQRASDIQAISNKNNLVNVFFRIDGQRVHYTTITTGSLHMIVNVLSNKADLETRTMQELRSGKVKVNNISRYGTRNIRFNYIPTKQGGSLNIRILSETSLLDYDKLGLSELQIIQMKKLEQLKQGLLLIVGPVGSGKSTTICTFLKNLLDKNKNICTVEDPVETVIEGINQVDISDSDGAKIEAKTKLTFATVSKSFLRHDPDVIVIGETRDKELLNVGIQASMTGHLAISTLHAKSAPSTIPRLIGMGADPYMIAENLTGIIAQRLVRRVCPHCIEEYEYTPTDDEAEIFDLDETVTLARGKGCNKCKNTGYLGRLVLFEYLPITNRIRDLIQKRECTDEIVSVAKSLGFQTMVEDGVQKALNHLTTLDEVRPFAEEERHSASL